MKHRRSSGPSTAVLVAILFVFFASGAASLIHEVTWTRLLRLVMGSTTYAVSTVLCAFMGGLALGSYVGGRWIDRRDDPLRIFALLEGAIGLYCLCLPLMIGFGEPLYRWLYQNTHASFYLLSLVRFSFCAIWLLLPATLMGATLPVLSRFFVHSPEQIGRRVGMLYALNTFGAVAGVSVTGFLLLPNLGMQYTIFVAVALNFLVCIAVFYCTDMSRWRSLRVSEPRNVARLSKQNLPWQLQIATPLKTTPSDMDAGQSLSCYWLTAFLACRR